MNAVPCAIAGWQEMPPFIHVLHMEVKVLPFVFKVWVHLGALTCGNGQSEPFTVGEFILICFSSHKQSLLYNTEMKLGVHPKLPRHTTHTVPTFVWLQSHCFIPAQRGVPSPASHLLSKLYGSLFSEESGSGMYPAGLYWSPYLIFRIFPFASILP